MIFSLAIYGAPYSSQSCHTALAFAQAAIATGHKIYRVFFYSEGVHHGSSLLTPQQDEIHFSDEWIKLSQANHFDLVVCIAASLKRGLIDKQEANRYEKPCTNLAEGFELSGLGQLLDAAVTSDRLITFGS